MGVWGAIVWAERKLRLVGAVLPSAVKVKKLDGECLVVSDAVDGFTLARFTVDGNGTKQRWELMRCKVLTRRKSWAKPRRRAPFPLANRLRRVSR